VAQPSPIPEKSGVTLQPPCSTCGSPMWLIGLSRVDDKHDLRTFKCQVCEHKKNLIVQFR